MVAKTRANVFGCLTGVPRTRAHRSAKRRDVGHSGHVAPEVSYLMHSEETRMAPEKTCFGLLAVTALLLSCVTEHLLSRHGGILPELGMLEPAK
jgi:hypothetical protein